MGKVVGDDLLLVALRSRMREDAEWRPEVCHHVGHKYVVARARRRAITRQKAYAIERRTCPPWGQGVRSV